MANDEALKKSLEVMDAAAREISQLGFDNVRVSEMFFAYGIRVGLLAEGLGVFAAARQVIDTMEKQSTGR